ncbi:TolC family protein [Chitinophaga nivalis]|uniref:TolC family protein n=1 Tax=Chitinophaga nivalis TaxID=2991709 RepID=A0ABT3IWF7_9BACT|nr:TolC family protein [Chitinophaga nivalis]MCW3461988.1 TolC family protein [Chitinophaga nivalis]MCW3488321.1 TolC family protein [Chitinophaga nivalis]
MMHLSQRLTSIFLVVWLLAMVSAVRAQEQPTLQDPVRLSVQEAVDYALANQNSIKTAKLDELIQLAKNKEVSGMALPNIAGNGSFQYNPVLQKQMSNLKNFGLPMDSFVVTTFQLKHNVTGEVRLTQTLFDPSVLVALQARKTLEELVHRNVKKSEVDVKVQVYKAYYNVLSAEKALKILSGNLVSVEHLLQETREINKNGLVEKLDVDRLVVQYTNLQTEQTKLRNLVELGTAALKYQMGMPLKQTITLTDTLSTARIVENTLDTDKFDYSQRIEYQLAETQKKANEYDLKRYKMKGLPSLSLFAATGALRASDKFDYLQTQMWYGYLNTGLSLSVPIFTGLQRKRQVDQAFLAVKKSELAIESAKQGIDLEREQSASTFRNNVLSLEAQEKNMELAQDVFNTTRIKYREGVGSSLEISTAENDLLTAQNNYFNALFNAIVAKVDLLRAYGRL